MSAKSMDEIATMLKGLRFRKKFFGGVSEADVWKQLEALQKEYRAAFDAQQEQYCALIRERDVAIAQMRKRAAAAAKQGSASGESNA